MSELLEYVRVLRSFIEDGVQTKEDGEALKFISLHPFWGPDKVMEKDKRYQHDGKLYKCLQTHLAQAGWEPGIDTASLFTEVNEDQTGSLSDPIPYNNNMELEKDKYYSQDGVIYLCTRDTEIPVYNDLKDLVGIYVNLIN